MFSRFGTTMAFAVLVLSQCPAQVPNAGFETWSGTDPEGWATSNAPPLYTNVTPSGIAHGGSSAARGEVVLVSTFTIQPVLQSGPEGEGFAYAQRPAAFTGYYQFFPQQGDRFGVNVVLFTGGVNGTPVAVAAAALPTAVSSYTQFNVAFQYLTGDQPDTCVAQFQIIGPVSGTPHAGSYFLLDDLAFSGTASVTGEEPLPTAVTLEQNYPNPFNAGTVISWHMPSSGRVSLAIYDLLGREVARPFDGPESAGFHSIRYEAVSLSSGTYLYRLTVGDVITTRRFVLLK